MGAVSTISSKGQITLPAEVRDRLGVGTGDRVEFVFDGTQTVVKPVRAQENPFAKWIGIGRSKAGETTTADIIREEREMRGWDELDIKDVEG